MEDYFTGTHYLMLNGKVRKFVDGKEAPFGTNHVVPGEEATIVSIVGNKVTLREKLRPETCQTPKEAVGTKPPGPPAPEA